MIALCVIGGAWGMMLFSEELFSEDTTTSEVTTTATSTQSTTEDTTISTTDPATEETTTAQTTEAEKDFIAPSGKYVALTFDDGPHDTNTAAILQLLEQYGAKATFFVTGDQLYDYRAPLLNKMIDLGCEIGNHTWSHKNLTTLTAAEIYSEVSRVNEKVYELTGYEISLLRPPGGNTNLSVMQSLYDAELRMHTINWNNDSWDWGYQAEVGKTITRGEAIEKTLEEIHNWTIDGGIILMHDLHSITPEVLKFLLEELTAEGYTFLTVSEMIDFASMGEDAYFSVFRSGTEIKTLK